MEYLAYNTLIITSYIYDDWYGMRKPLLALSLICLVLTSILPVQGVAQVRTIGVGAYIPEPRLLSPRGEKVKLKGKTTLGFIWSPHASRSLGGRRYFDFRIYKGYQMLESTLIFKETVPGSRYKLEVNSDIFENGQIYTWSLRQGYKTMGKSRRSVYPFMVVK